MTAAIKMHVKKGDTVLVLSGKDKGKEGQIIEALPKKAKVVVEGVNRGNFEWQKQDCKKSICPKLLKA